MGVTAHVANLEGTIGGEKSSLKKDEERKERNLSSLTVKMTQTTTKRETLRSAMRKRVTRTMVPKVRLRLRISSLTMSWNLELCLIRRRV